MKRGKPRAAARIHCPDMRGLINDGRECAFAEWIVSVSACGCPSGSEGGKCCGLEGPGMVVAETWGLRDDGKRGSSVA